MTTTVRKGTDKLIDQVEAAWLMTEPVTGSEVYYGRTNTEYVLFLYADNPLYKYLKASPHRVTNLVLMGKVLTNDLFETHNAIIKLSFENISIVDHKIFEGKSFLMYHNLWPHEITSLQACEEIEAFRKDFEKFRREENGTRKKKRS